MLKHFVLSSITVSILSLNMGMATAKDKIDHLLENTPSNTCLSVRVLSPRGLFSGIYFKPQLGQECFNGGLGGSSWKSFAEAIDHEMQQVGFLANEVLSQGNNWEAETKELPNIDLDKTTSKSVEKWLRKNGGLAMFRDAQNQMVLTTYGKGERINNAEHELILQGTYTGASIWAVFEQAFPSTPR